MMRGGGAAAVRAAARDLACAVGSWRTHVWEVVFERSIRNDKVAKLVGGAQRDKWRIGWRSKLYCR